MRRLRLGLSSGSWLLRGANRLVLRTCGPCSELFLVELENVSYLSYLRYLSYSSYLSYYLNVNYGGVCTLSIWVRYRDKPVWKKTLMGTKHPQKRTYKKKEKKKTAKSQREKDQQDHPWDGWNVLTWPFLCIWSLTPFLSPQSELYFRYVIHI